MQNIFIRNLTQLHYQAVDLTMRMPVAHTFVKNLILQYYLLGVKSLDYSYDYVYDYLIEM